MKLYQIAKLIYLCISFVYAQQPISDCKKSYLLYGNVGLYCYFYPINITGPVPGFPGLSLRRIVDWQYYNGNSFADGPVTDLNFNIPIDASLQDQVVDGSIYGLPMTISNFTFEGIGWFRAKKTGWHTFNIEADTAAQIYIANDTRMYCVENSVNIMNIQFKVTSIPSQPLEENPSGSVYLYAGFPYLIKLSYLHMQGGPSLNTSLIDPDGEYHSNITPFIQQFNLYGPGEQIRYYDLVNVTTTIGWSGNSTTFLGYSSTANGPYNAFTATTYYIYGTPTPHITSTFVPSSTSIIVSTSEVTLLPSSEPLVGSYSFDSISSEGFSTDSYDIAESSSSVNLVNSTANFQESFTTPTSATSVVSSSEHSSETSSTGDLSSVPYSSSSIVTVFSTDTTTAVTADYGNSSTTNSAPQIHTSSELTVSTASRETSSNSNSLIGSADNSLAETGSTTNQFSTSYYTATMVITDIITTICPETIFVGSESSQSTSYHTSIYTATNTVTTTTFEYIECLNANKPDFALGAKTGSALNSPDQNENPNQIIVSGGQKTETVVTQNVNGNNGINAEDKSTATFIETINSGNTPQTVGPFIPQVTTTAAVGSANPTAAIEVNSNAGPNFFNRHLVYHTPFYVLFFLFM
ncbi:hypothetical protein C6P45_002820 [Maudiozyma exigua]|uniref:PA14 domain-containing protein n=1 Tax=Maudiozyma exigua TaxID=34358 RepID=A0A9P6VWC6_MAUEX|nr:hypothetical protein C6P45_002820 [Kazachstania exigua]